MVLHSIEKLVSQIMNYSMFNFAIVFASMFPWYLAFQPPKVKPLEFAKKL